MGRRGLEPQSPILEQVPSERKREAKLYWTECLMAQGHRLTNGEWRCLDAREREERAMEEAQKLGRELISHSIRCA
jgi:hypothetical protein